jgi:hypothetical protein
MILLKQEINDASSALLSLSKWKLAALAVLAATGLGIHENLGCFEHGYLLLFLTPLVCAYIDALSYHGVARIHLIAKYLREYSGTDQDMIELRDYEQYIRECRRRGLYANYEGTARFVVSLVASIAVPGLAVVVDKYQVLVLERLWVLVVPLLGIALGLGGYIYHRAQFRKIEG